MSDWPKTYAWTPGQGGYKFYPQYANFKLWEDGRCVVTVRAPEFRTIGQPHYQMGEIVCIQLPPDAAVELRAFFASGTLTEGGDVKQAPGESLSGPALEEGDAHD